MPPVPQTQKSKDLPSNAVNSPNQNLEGTPESVAAKSYRETPSAINDRITVHTGAIHVPYRSPPASVFGDEYHVEDSILLPLPKNIEEYLDKHGLEAYFVPADGNCLFRALTFGPGWSKHDLARAATAAYLGGLKQSGNDLAVVLDDDHIEKVRKNGEWMDRDIGQPQLKGFAEALRVTIEVLDASKLGNPPLVYSPQPNGPPDWTMKEMATRSREPSRILLYNEHYYPVFPKGTFPNRQGLPGKPNARDHRIHTTGDSSRNKPSTISSNGQTQIDEEVAENQLQGDINKGNSIIEPFDTLPCEQTPRAAMLGRVSRTLTPKIGDVTTLILQSLGASCFGAGLVLLGGSVMKFIYGKFLKRRETGIKRKVNYADEGTFVRAKW